MLNAIAPTESLASITASRVRGAPGRRPPSVVLLKDVVYLYAEKLNRTHFFKTAYIFILKLAGKL